MVPDHLSHPLTDALDHRTEELLAWARSLAGDPDRAALVTALRAALADPTGVEASPPRTARADRARRDFLTNMSHEIRTPLNGILGMIELTLATSLTPDQLENLELARSSARHLLERISDVLDLSKIEAGRLEIERIAFPIRSLLRETLRPQAARAVDRGLKFIVSIDPAVPQTIIGDPSKLRQILLNLISNAIKFTETGGILVDVRAGRDDLATMTIAVTDTGPGISPARQAAIFDAYVQSAASTSRTHGGTGLGLAIARRLARLLGGDLDVLSVEGRGSTFTFTVEALPAPAQLPATAGAAFGRHVAILGDLAADAMALADTLRRHGAHVTTTSLESTAYGNLRSEVAFALVRTDDDLIAVRALRRRQPNLELVVVTPIARRGDAARLAPERPCPILPLPLDEHEVLEALAVALRASVPDLSPITTAEPPLPLSVLVAEDNRVNQRLIGRVLERDGHAFAMTSDGAEAVAAFLARRFDVVLLDLQMPVMDGLEAARIMRAHERGLQRTPTPIVALTANAQAEAHDACVAAGIDGFLTKPFSIERLQRELTHLAQTREIRRHRRSSSIAPPDLGAILRRARASLATMRRAVTAGALDEAARECLALKAWAIGASEQTLAILAELIERELNEPSANLADLLQRLDAALDRDREAPAPGPAGSGDGDARAVASEPTRGPT